MRFLLGLPVQVHRLDFDMVTRREEMRNKRKLLPAAQISHLNVAKVHASP